MKSLLIGCLLIPSFCFSQEVDHTIKDTLFLKNGARFVIGDKVKLGYGSGANKDFEFVHLSDWSIAGPVKLKSQWALHEMVIKGFKMEGTKRTGKQYYLVLGGGNLSPYWCEINAAMDMKEVIVPGVNDQTATAQTQPAASSPADELKKLKALLDSGAITQQEYDSTKKKILARM
jgi:hypothetical protein